MGLHENGVPIFFQKKSFCCVVNEKVFASNKCKEQKNDGNIRQRI